MDSNHPLLHSPLPDVPSPHPAETVNFPFHDPQNIGQIWTELASITVSAFTPQLISRLRTFISHTPCFELDNHLQMLGAIVVRHVTLCLSDSDPPCNSPSRKHSQPSLSRPQVRAKRRSYRDLAYHAVRINRIVPQCQPLHMEPTSSSCSSSTTKMPRRLSIQKASSLVDVASRRPSTTIRPHPSSNPSTKENDTSVLNQSSSVLIPPAKSSHSVALREETLYTRSQNRAQPFPRADVTTSIESASMRNINSPPSRHKVVAQPQNLSEYANRFRNDSKTTAPISRLVQMRKQRAEKKRHNIK